MSAPSHESTVPIVVVEAPGGDRYTLRPGDLLGRGSRSAIPLESPTISEAHAAVSLRADGFFLLGLRGTLGRNGRWVSEIRLVPDQQIELSEDVAITVRAVVVPELVLALEGLGPSPQTLDYATCSIWADPPTMRAGYHGDAQAWVWTTEGRWWVRDQDGVVSPLEIGDTVPMGTKVLTVVGVRADHPGETVRTRAAFPALLVEVFPHVTRIHVATRQVEISGRSHDILRHTARLTTASGPVHWTEVAGSIWRVNATPENWYRNRARLAEQLRNHGLPHDLVAIRGGHVSLSLRPGIDQLTLHGD